MLDECPPGLVTATVSPPPPPPPAARHRHRGLHDLFIPIERFVGNGTTDLIRIRATYVINSFRPWNKLVFEIH